MFVHLDHRLHTPIYENRANESFEHIAENFAGFIEINVAVVELEVFAERIRNVRINLRLLGSLLLELLPLLLVHVSKILVRHARPSFLVQNELLQAKEADQFCEEFVLRQKALRLVGIERKEIFLRYKLLSLTVIDVVLLEHRVLDQI